MFKFIRTTAVCLAILGTSFSPAVVTAQSSSTSPSTSNRLRVFDVRLNAKHELTGAIVDASGKPKKAQVVAIRSTSTRSKSKEPTATIKVKTDEHGLFRSELDGGGLYQINTESGATLVRVWTSNAAPPSATDHILILDDSRLLVRGQRPIGDLFRINDPVLVATVTAAAIAIPIAIHNSRDDSKSGS